MGSKRKVRLTEGEKHRGILKDSGWPIQKRILIGIPLTGLVRAEWMMARYGQVIPVNWAAGEVTGQVEQYSPMRYLVADARNMIVDHVVKNEWDWLIFIDHDVVIPPHTLRTMGDYITGGKHPVVCGWYNAKGTPPEPLIFRGRGNSWYRKWKPGEKVWVDAVPMGCTLINGKLLKAMWEDSEEYQVMNERPRRVFETPREAFFDPVKGFVTKTGTEDIHWCDKILKGDYLKKAGFPEYQRKRYPFLADTSLRCGHIDWNGKIF